MRNPPIPEQAPGTMAVSLQAATAQPELALNHINNLTNFRALLHCKLIAPTHSLWFPVQQVVRCGTKYSILWGDGVTSIGGRSQKIPLDN